MGADQKEPAVPSPPVEGAGKEAQKERGTPSRRARRSTRGKGRVRRSGAAADEDAQAGEQAPQPDGQEAPGQTPGKRRSIRTRPTRRQRNRTPSRRDGADAPPEKRSTVQWDTDGNEKPEQSDTLPAGTRSDVHKLMLVNDIEQQEVRIAIVEDDKLEQLFQERASGEHIVGNIHKGIVVNLVPNIEAAFVEFGYRKHGFLHVSDVLPSAVGKTRRADNIRALLREGQEIIVQVTKEGIGDKGPSLTTYLSLPGRYLVLMPGLTRRGVSRRIAAENERARLREIVSNLEVADKIGVIARTAAEGRDQKDIARDLDYLLRLWHAISQRAERSKPPAMVYQESDPVTRVIRDVFSEDIRKVIVDSQEVHDKVRDFLRVVLPRHVRKVKLHTDADPLFHHYGVEQEIEKMHSRTVQLASGGSIVVDQTEAMVTIDVNSGHYKGHGDAEKTAFNINMEAAGEIARQIRLRDLGGVLAIDFIDMEDAGNRAKVERALWNALKRDRARLRMLRMSPFCIVEMTRQRQRQSLRQTSYVTCPCCGGTGLIKSHETLALQAVRQIKANLDHPDLAAVELSVCPETANYLNNIMREGVNELERTSGKKIRVFADPSMRPGMHAIRFLNNEAREISPGG